ncbi:putative transposon, En/Spm-like, transposase-associated domain protein [Tanacetum coccineum]
MTWHSEERVDDGLMRHPENSPAWKMFDKKYPEFGCESRNVRLGLVSNGFNPFRTMTISHSTWHAVLIPYNLPLWLCMKQPSFIIFVLIDGIKAPGDMIDVYLKPLIDELNDMWRDGVSTYAASSKRNGYSTKRNKKKAKKQTNPSTGWKGQSQKSSQMKKLQLEGLKLPNLKLYYKENTKLRDHKLPTGKITFKLYKNF